MKSRIVADALERDVGDSGGLTAALDENDSAALESIDVGGTNEADDADDQRARVEGLAAVIEDAFNADGMGRAAIDAGECAPTTTNLDGPDSLTG